MTIRDDLYNLRGYGLAERYSDGFADGFATGLKAEKYCGGCEYCLGDETGTTLSIDEIHGRDRLSVLSQSEAYGTPVLYTEERKIFGRRNVYPIYYCPMCGRKLL